MTPQAQYDMNTNIFEECIVFWGTIYDVNNI